MYTHDSLVVASSGPAAWLGLRHHLASFPPRPYEKKIIKGKVKTILFASYTSHSMHHHNVVVRKRRREECLEIERRENHLAPTHHHLYIEASIAGGTSAYLLPISMPPSTHRSTVAIIEFSPIPLAFLQHIAAGAGVVRWCR